MAHGGLEPKCTRTRLDRGHIAGIMWRLQSQGAPLCLVMVSSGLKLPASGAFGRREPSCLPSGPGNLGGREVEVGKRRARPGKEEGPKEGTGPGSSIVPEPASADFSPEGLEAGGSRSCWATLCLLLLEPHTQPNGISCPCSASVCFLEVTQSLVLLRSTVPLEPKHKFEHPPCDWTRPASALPHPDYDDVLCFSAYFQKFFRLGSKEF